MTRVAAALLLLLLLQGGSCQLTVEVETKKLELEESGESLGEEYRLPRRLKLSLTCKLTRKSSLENLTVVWTPPGGASVDEPRFSISQSLADDKRSVVSTLSVKAPENSDIGEYRCLGNVSGVVNSSTGGLRSRPLLKLLVDGRTSYDWPVWPGSRVTVVCQVDGMPKGSVRWTHDDAERPGSNGTYTIDDVSYERDRGYIVCRSKNEVGGNSAKLYLRVKNPTGFLLPMIVVIVEIALIALIVVLYELAMRRRRQQQGAEDKAD